MSAEYLQVVEEENEAPIELPLEKDGTMLLTTVKGVFPGACGLKFRNPQTNTLRAVRLNDGILHPPTDGWDARAMYLCVFPPKRKIDAVECEERGAAKTKKLEKKLACTDLICLGLPWKCTEESVKEYFEQFGEVVMMQLKKDATGKFKGFGFIRFDSYPAQMRALGQRHNIDGRWVDVCIPYSKGGVIPQVSSKVFVGRCTEDISAEDLKSYFSDFGEVVDVFVPKPFRAFAFVTFLDPEVAQNVCGEDYVIKGVSVSVSSAEPKARHRSRGGPPGGGPQENWNNSNYQSNISPNISGDTNITVPMRLVAAALNAEMMGGGGGGGGGRRGGGGGGETNWHPAQDWMGSNRIGQGNTNYTQQRSGNQWNDNRNPQ